LWSKEKQNNEIIEVNSIYCYFIVHSSSYYFFTYNICKNC
jgi:hypothetical protein